MTKEQVTKMLVRVYGEYVGAANVGDFILSVADEMEIEQVEKKKLVSELMSMEGL